MTAPPPQHYSPVWADDSRATPPLVGDEREILTAYLDWHRRTFELKCAGVPRSGSPSGASRPRT